MEFFHGAKTVRLKSSHGGYLFAEDGDCIYALSSEGMEEWTAKRARAEAEAEAEERRKDRWYHKFVVNRAEVGLRDWWSVEFVVNSNSDSVLRLKGRFGKYLDASDRLSYCRGGEVVQSPPSLDSSLEWKPVRVGTRVKLCTHYGSFLNAKDGDDITHDIFHSNTILWNVEVVEREQEGSATNVDDKALEEGSATKRRHETGEGSSVAKSPPGDSGEDRKDNRVKYRRHFWNLKIKLFEEPGRTDVLVRGGGSGTTALVRDVCKDVWEQFGTVVWIGTPHKIDSALISEEMLLQFILERKFDGNPLMSGDHEEIWGTTPGLFSLEQKARCLIVVDNVDDPRTWKEFDEILRKVKTCQVIFIARRDIDTLSHQISQCGRESDLYRYEVEDLSYVVNGLRFLEDTSTSPSKGVCQLIVKKCERLPTAIVFGLRDGPRGTEWKARIPSGDCLRELDHLRRALKICNLIKRQAGMADYEAEDLHVKKVLKILISGNECLLCFLYLSILPPNNSISCQRVSRLWAAEGCLPQDRKPQQIFKDLLEEELIYSEERRRDGELSSFKVDNRVREIIASLSDLSILVSTTHLGGTCWRGKLECLSVQGTIGPLSLDEKRSCELSWISALEVSIDEDRTTTFEASSNLKHHKVLDLTGAPLKFVPRELFERTTDVRYLSLRNTSIKVIPRSIRKLRQLQFLDAKQSLVTNLPQAVEGLKNICQILIYHHEKDPLMESNNLIGFKASCRIGGLTRLEKLCFVESDDRILEDLKNLTKLRRLGITKLKKDDGEKLCSSLEKLEKLQSLNIHAFDEDEIIDLHRLSSPPKSLRRLYLHGRLEELPGWIKSHHGLKKIILTWSQIGEGEGLLATLGDVKKLSELELRRAYDGEQLDFKEGQFPELKNLLLDELGGLRSVIFEKGTLSYLEELTISRCQWLESVPSGIGQLPFLRKLTFFDMSHEFYEKIKADHEKGGYKIFQNIKEVYFTRWRAGCWEIVPF